MSKGKSSKALVFDVALVAFWIVVLLVELLVTGDIVWAVVALVCIFIFSALLGRDIRKRALRA